MIEPIMLALIPILLILSVTVGVVVAQKPGDYWPTGQVGLVCRRGVGNYDGGPHRYRSGQHRRHPSGDGWR